MFRHVPAALILALVIQACGSGTPSKPVETALPPNPNGMLLDGRDSDPAILALRRLPPSPADERDVHGTFLATRMTAILAPGATIGQVNTALENYGARIVSMFPGSPAVSLVVPSLADPAAAIALGTQFGSTPAFLIAYPAFTPPAPATPPKPGRGPLAGSDGSDQPYLEAMRMRAAWNAKLLGENNPIVTLVVPGHYYQEGPHPGISAQQFASNAGGYESFPSFLGNLGYAVCSIAGADAGSFGGIHPLPGNLRVLSAPIGNLSWTEAVIEILNLSGAGGNGRTVICSYPTYDELTGYTGIPEPYLKTQRALDALTYRTVVELIPEYKQALHVVAAGNFGWVPGDAGEACFGSPFSLGECFVDLHQEVVAGDTDASEALKAEFLSYWNSYVPSPPQKNLIMVGSSQGDGSEAAISSRGSDVRVIGEDVAGLCAKLDELCATGGSVALSSTLAAAPQVAGLAAYMWSLAPTKTVSEIQSIIEDAYNFGSVPGVVDAYQAVLALDTSIETATVRRTILDVDAADDFDEVDLNLFLLELASGSGDLRYDLNGDGQVGGDGTAWVDLDVNQPPAFTQLSLQTAGPTISLNEKSVTDLDVLCWYAYSYLYTGNEAVRDDLLGGCAPGSDSLLVDVYFPEFIEPESPSQIEVRAGILSDGIVNYIEGAEITISAEDGDVAQSQGLTDGSEVFTTTVSLYEGENSTRVTVRANFPEGGSAESVVSARRSNKIEYQSGVFRTEVFVSASYRSGPNSDLTIVYDHGIADEVRDEPGLYSKALIDSSSGSGFGMSMRGIAMAENQSNVQIGGNSLNAACGMSVDGSARLSNVNTSAFYYQSYTSATVVFDLDFAVWGEPAAFSLIGSIASSDYDVRLHGPSVNIGCRPDGPEPNPCSSVNETGILEPGEYSLSLDIRMWVALQKACGNQPSSRCSASGTLTFGGSLDGFHLTVTQAAAGSAEAGPGTVRRR